MSVPPPHFLMFSAASVPDRSEAGRTASLPNGSTACGHWTFVLESTDGSQRLEVADEERGVARQRLELLAVVRGLEALDQPSRVTLVSPSDYVRRGIRFGLRHWRDNDWLWESYGRQVPVRNADLWKRVDRALQIHDVRCRILRVDAPATAVPEPKLAPQHARRPSGRRDPRRRKMPSLSQRFAWLLSLPLEWLERRFQVAMLCAE